MSKNTGHITTTGLLLGLAYGGAFLIEETKKSHIKHHDIFLSILLLTISHGLIEDTLLLISIGGDVMIILVFRFLMSLSIISIIGFAVNRSSDKVFYKYFFKK